MRDFFLLFHLVWIFRATKFGTYFRFCIVKKGKEPALSLGFLIFYMRNVIKIMMWQLERSGFGDFKEILY